MASAMVGCFCTKVRKLSLSSHSGDARNRQAENPGFGVRKQPPPSSGDSDTARGTYLDGVDKRQDSVDMETPKIFQLNRL